jgi:hypothetical protein
MEAEAPGPTTTAKVGFAAFVLALICWMGGGVVLGLYASSSISDSDRLRALFGILGMCVGLGCGAMVTRLISARFVPARTRARWNKILNNPYFPPRYRGMAALFNWALVPKDRDAL